MGYDAYVRCNCYKTGKVKSPPPFPFEIDVDGNERILTPECTENQNSEKCREQSRAYYNWIHDACEHPDMDFINLRIANIWGMSDFKWALNQLGVSYFPILTAQLPVANGGMVEAILAYSMLKELELFRSFGEIAIGTYLIDSTTGQTIYNYTGNADGVFAWYGKAGIDLGFDSDGFFVRKRPDKEAASTALSDAIQGNSQPKNMEIFRSMRFEQRPYSPKLEVDKRESDYFEKSDEAEIELIDLETNHRLVVKAGVVKVINSQDRAARKSVYPRLLHVEKRPFGVERYEYILESLKELCQASIETGNPINWA